MILIKFNQNIENNRWLSSGGNLIVDAILNGTFEGIGSDGTFLHSIPSVLLEDIKIDLSFSQNIFHGTQNVPVWETATCFPKRYSVRNAYKMKQDITLNKDKTAFEILKIKDDSNWGVFTEFDAYEIKRICSRIKYVGTCPFEFMLIDNCYFEIVRYNDCEFINREELDRVYSNCFYTNNKGCFVMTNLGHKIAVSCDQVYPYSDLEWIKQKSF